jgi:hypothetical protein
LANAWTKVYDSVYNVIIYTCTLGNGEESDPLIVVRYNDNSVQVTGTFGAAVTIKGAIHPVTPVYVTMKDALNNDLSFTADSPPTQMLPGSYMLKAVAGAVTSVIVSLKLKGG